MSYSGHLRELKEVDSLPICLTQLAKQTQVNIRLIESNGSIILNVIQLPTDPFCECIHSLSYELITLLNSGADIPDYHIAVCMCGKDLLMLPICSEEGIDGILVVYPYEKEHQQLFLNIGKMISNYLLLARNAVRKTKKSLNILDVHEEFFRTTELITNLEAFYAQTLETILPYINADAGIFIPRATNLSQWDKPVFKTKEDVPYSWLSQLATWAITKYEAEYCPMIITVDNQISDLDYQKMEVSAFISSTMYYEEQALAIIVFCSQDANVPSFDDLELLESLKGTISLRLHNLHHRMFKEHFLQNAFHSLKAPSHSIFGLVEMINSNIDVFPPQQQEDLKLLEQQVQRLFRLTQKTQLLARLRKSSGEQVILSLQDLIQEVTLIFQITSKRWKSVKILLNLPEDPCDIIGNKDELCEVLENLLDNSLKVTNTDREIRVKLEIQSSVYQVSVSDDGPGVPKEQRSIIFEEFVSIARTGMTESSGLGLTIAREIIEAHGGKLSYVDPPSGHGACFQFTLPRIEKDGSSEE